jgi:hypothetical protein
MAELAGGEESNRSGGERGREMLANARGVPRPRLADGEIARVLVDCARDGEERAGLRSIALGELAASLRRLVPREGPIAIGVLKVVGEADVAGLVAALAIGEADNPTPWTDAIAPVSKPAPGAIEVKS